MEAQKVHEYSVETGPNGLPVARLGRVHNLITFIESGQQKKHFLDGRWVDDGGNPLNEADVPPHMKATAESLPFNPGLEFSADVQRDCEFCEYTGPSREYAKHLADKHIRTQPAAVASIDTTPNPDHTPAPPRLRPEELPPGNYVLDDEGFVVMNADGTPRKRAGRPRTATAE